MCFSKNASLLMAMSGIVCSLYSYNKNLHYFTLCLFYFVIMQIIHYIAYLKINKCDDKTNQMMSRLNFLHISFQPFISLLASYEVFKKFNTITPNQLQQLKGIIIISLIVGIIQASRMYGNIGINKHNCEYCGSKTCSFSGKHHVDFSLPLRTNPEYFTPSLFSHFTFLFLPFLLFNNTTRLIGFITFVFGMSPSIIWPGISPTESASIWCFGSIIHILLILALAYKNKQVF